MRTPRLLGSKRIRLVAGWVGCRRRGQHTSWEYRKISGVVGGFTKIQTTRAAMEANGASHRFGRIFLVERDKILREVAPLSPRGCETKKRPAGAHAMGISAKSQHNGTNSSACSWPNGANRVLEVLYWAGANEETQALLPPSPTNRQTKRAKVAQESQGGKKMKLNIGKRYLSQIPTFPRKPCTFLHLHAD